MSASLYFFASAKKIDELKIYIENKTKKNRNKIHSKKAIICATYSLLKSKELTVVTDTVSRLHLKKGKAKNAKRMRSVQMPKVTFYRGFIRSRICDD